MGVLVKEARSLLAELNQADLTTLTEGEVTELVTLSAEVMTLAEAGLVRAAGRLDVIRAWEPDGARGAAAWLGWQAGLSRGRAGSVLTCARQLRDMPLTEAAFVAGGLSMDHGRLLAHAQHTDPAGFVEDEERLVGAAGRLLFSGFQTVITYWVHAHDPDGAEAAAATLRDQRRLDASPSLGGVVFVDALLDPVAGAISLRELQRLEQELFDADWADARNRLDPAATTADLCGTAKQRRADALRIMAERSAAKPPGATEPRVLLHVLAGHESVERMCELSDGTVVTPGQVLPVLEKADVERVIFDGPSKVIDIGVRRRLFTGATRTAVELRDRTCTHPSCDQPAEACEIDHIVPYEHGGETTQANARCYCRYHHRWHHRHHRPPPPAA